MTPTMIRRGPISAEMRDESSGENNQRMCDLQCSIDMGRLPGCNAEEILVKRVGHQRFWCTAAKGQHRLELGPVVLDFSGKLTERWHPSNRAVIGGQENLEAFFRALEGFLRQWKVIA